LSSLKKPYESTFAAGDVGSGTSTMLPRLLAFSRLALSAEICRVDRISSSRRSRTADTYIKRQSKELKPSVIERRERKRIK
jgi:hypothetical protein